MNEFIEDFKKRYETDKDYQLKVKKVGFVSIILVISSVVFFAFDPNSKDSQATEIPKNRVTENYINSEKENFIDDKKVIYGEYEENQDSIDLPIPNSQMSEQEDDLNLNEYMGKRQNMISRMNSEPTRRSYDPAPPMRRREITSSSNYSNTEQYDNVNYENNQSKQEITEEPKQQQTPKGRQKVVWGNSTQGGWGYLMDDVVLTSNKPISRCTIMLTDDVMVNGNSLRSSQTIGGVVTLNGQTISIEVPKYVEYGKAPVTMNLKGLNSSGTDNFLISARVTGLNESKQEAGEEIGNAVSRNLGVGANTVRSILSPRGKAIISAGTRVYLEPQNLNQ